MTLKNLPFVCPLALEVALRAAYATPPRAYHDFSHVEEVLDHMASVPHWSDPVAAALAVLFHDAICAGLSLVDVDSAYDALLGAGGRARVMPGDPRCSLLVERLESDDPNYRMPLGLQPLDAGLRCAIEKWIAASAERD